MSSMLDQAPAAESAQGFNASEVIVGHVSNTSADHPLIHLPTVFGVDLSVTKHVLMLWIVAAVLFVGVTAVVRRYIRQDRLIPTGAAGVLELGVEFVRDVLVGPYIHGKWTDVWLPLLLTFFLFILSANLVGLIPIFDVLGLVNHYVLHLGDESFLARVIHGSSTVTGNYNVTAGLAVVSALTVMVAGIRAHGFFGHWANLVPRGLPKAIYVLLIPMELVSLLVRPFALTMRLAANMTAGHIALLAFISFVFIFTERLGALTGVGVGLGFSVPLSVAFSGLEMIVILVQALVFTLLSAVFIGMAIHAHH